MANGSSSKRRPIINFHPIASIMNFFSHHPKLRFKVYTAIILGLVVALPWSATALNRPETNLLPKASVLASTKTEDLIVQSLMEISSGQIDAALGRLDQVIATTPNFKLAHLVKGDLLMARGQQFQAFGSPNPSSEDVAGYREEARKRIERYLAKDTDNLLPEPIWQLDRSQAFILVVDADKSRLFVYRNENGTPQYTADFYVTIGKNGSEKKYAGDKRTPLGVYFTSPKLTQKLADMYGDGAYPLSYPNEWDRRQGKTGSGIWLHGTPQDTYSRAPQSSDGCVVLSNQDLNTLMPILQQGNVPIIVSKGMLWLKPNQAPKDKQALLESLETWRKDWESQETETYLGHYANDFSNGNLDFNHWAEEKRRIQASKPKVDIKLSNLSVLRYPNSPLPMAIVTFDQSFRSNALDSQMRKRQYWIFENQQWKIIYEGAA
jgi:murein L,D-transpeptidase YafK